MPTQHRPLSHAKTAAQPGGALPGVPRGTAAGMRGSLWGGHGARDRSRPPTPTKMALGTWGAGLIISRRQCWAPQFAPVLGGQRVPSGGSSVAPGLAHPLAHQDKERKVLGGGTRGPSPKTPAWSLARRRGTGGRAWPRFCHGAGRGYACGIAPKPLSRVFISSVPREGGHAAGEL